MRPRTRRVLVLGAILTLVGGGVAGIGLSGAGESWLFYFPSRRAFRDPPGVEAVRFETADGLTLSGWYWSARGSGDALAGAIDQTGGVDVATRQAERAALDAARGAGGDDPLPTGEGLGAFQESGDVGRPATILVVHGNAGCLPDHDEFCAFLADHGFNVLLFDYRGYGRSDLPKRGLNRADLVLDTRAAFDYLLTRADVDPERIGLLGYSLGGNIGLGFVVGEERVRAVVTLATFSRWQDVAGDHGGPLGRFLIPRGMDAADSVRSLGNRPLMIVHGDDDDIVPFRHAGLLETAAREAGVGVTRLDVPGADHLNMTQRVEVQRAIAAFFRQGLAAGERAEDGGAPHQQKLLEGGAALWDTGGVIRPGRADGGIQGVCHDERARVSGRVARWTSVVGGGGRGGGARLGGCGAAGVSGD